MLHLLNILTYLLLTVRSMWFCFGVGGRLPEEWPEERDAHSGAPYLGCRRARLTLRTHPRWRSLSVAHCYWSSNVKISNDISNPNLLYRSVLLCLMYFNSTSSFWLYLSNIKQFHFTKTYFFQGKLLFKVPQSTKHKILNPSVDSFGKKLRMSH